MLVVLICNLYKVCILFFTSGGLGQCCTWLNEGLMKSCVMVYCVDLLACVLFGLAKAMTYYADSEI